MKYLGFVLTVSFLNFANATDILECKSVADDSHTIVVKAETLGKYTMTTYRALYGRSFPPDRRDVSLIPSSNKSLTVYTDFYKSVRLSVLKGKNGEMQGEFVDTRVNPKPLAVKCGALTK